MIEIIDIIIAIFFVIGIISFIVFFILGVGYKLQNIEEANFLEYAENNIYFRIAAILSIISFISIFSLNSYANKLSRKEIIEKIEKLDSSNFTLFINDKLQKNDSLIVALKKIRKQTSDRNTGSKEIALKIKSGKGIIRLRLLRNFGTKTKYWVFYENYETTSENCIGEVNTNSLNAYK